MGRVKCRSALELGELLVNKMKELYECPTVQLVVDLYGIVKSVQEESRRLGIGTYVTKPWKYRTIEKKVSFGCGKFLVERIEEGYVARYVNPILVFVTTYFTKSEAFSRDDLSVIEELFRNALNSIQRIRKNIDEKNRLLYDLCVNKENLDNPQDLISRIKSIIDENVRKYLNKVLRYENFTTVYNVDISRKDYNKIKGDLERIISAVISEIISKRKTYLNNLACEDISIPNTLDHKLKNKIRRAIRNIVRVFFKQNHELLTFYYTLEEDINKMKPDYESELRQREEVCGKLMKNNDYTVISDYLSYLERVFYQCIKDIKEIRKL